jgi:hypothetical protein
LILGHVKPDEGFGLSSFVQWRPLVKILTCTSALAVNGQEERGTSYRTRDEPETLSPPKQAPTTTSIFEGLDLAVHDAPRTSIIVSLEPPRKQTFL